MTTNFRENFNLETVAEQPINDAQLQRDYVKSFSIIRSLALDLHLHIRRKIERAAPGRKASQIARESAITLVLIIVTTK